LLVRRPVQLQCVVYHGTADRKVQTWTRAVDPCTGTDRHTIADQKRFSKRRLICFLFLIESLARGDHVRSYTYIQIDMNSRRDRASRYTTRHHLS